MESDHVPGVYNQGADHLFQGYPCYRGGDFNHTWRNRSDRVAVTHQWTCMPPGRTHNVPFFSLIDTDNLLGVASFTHTLALALMSRTLASEGREPIGYFIIFIVPNWPQKH